MNSSIHINSPVAALHEPISSGHGQSIFKSRETPSFPRGSTLSASSNVVYKGLKIEFMTLNYDAQGVKCKCNNRFGVCMVYHGLSTNAYSLDLPGESCLRVYS